MAASVGRPAAVYIKKTDAKLKKTQTFSAISSLGHIFCGCFSLGEQMETIGSKLRNTNMFPVSEADKCIFKHLIFYAALILNTVLL